ncbi:MAG: Hint domain-containing protein, partial [Pseudomonadota bacterium]
MWVSPQHRILLSGPACELLHGARDLLVPAKALLNGRTIALEPAGKGVEYVHFFFDQHEIVHVDGLESESLYPGHMALDAFEAAARDELLTIFPELASLPESYGPTARPALRMREGTALGAQLLSA